MKSKENQECQVERGTMTGLDPQVRILNRVNKISLSYIVKLMQSEARDDRSWTAYKALEEMLVSKHSEEISTGRKACFKRS